MTKLTKSTVDRIKPPPSGNIHTWDSELEGFGLRTSDRGTKTFIIKTRVTGGPQIQMKVGRYGPLTPDEARKRAKDLLAKASNGIDPREEIRAGRKAEQERLNAPRVSDMLAAYLKRKGRRPSTVAEYERLARVEINPRIGRRRVRDVTTTEIEEFIQKYFADRPYVGNRTLALLSGAWNKVALKKVWCTSNPCKGVEKAKERKRRRYLEPEERARLIMALNDTRGPAADAIRLAMLTGARIGECLQARVEDFDLSKKCWDKPASTTKTDQPHRTFLSAPAAKLVSGLIERAKGPLLFPGVSGQPQRYYRNTWARIIEKAYLPGLRVHDLRHSFASAAISSGYSLALTGELLGHSSWETTKRYTHLLEDPAREAMERIGKVISGDNSEDGSAPQAGNVTPMKKGA